MKRTTGHLQQSKILRRILSITASLLVIFTLLISLTFAFYLFYLRKEQRQYKEQILGYMQTFIDQQVLDLKEIIYRQETDLDITLLSSMSTGSMTPSDAMKIQEIQFNLLRIMEARSDLQDIFVYVRKARTVISSEGSRSASYFFNDYFHSVDADIQSIIDNKALFQKITVISCRYARRSGYMTDQTSTNLAFLYPSQNVVVMVVINRNAVDERIRQYLPDALMNMIVVDENKNVYGSAMGSMPVGILGNLIPRIQDGQHSTYWAEGKKLSIYSSTSPFSGMRTFLITNESSASSGVLELTYIMIFTLLLFTLVDALIYISLRNQWHRPLTRILSSIKENVVKESIDEYEILNNIIAESRHRIDDMELVFSKQRRQIENFYIDEAMASLIDVPGFEQLTGKKYVLVTFVTEKETGEVDVSGFIEFEVALSGKFDMYKLHTFTRAKYYFLVIDSCPEYKTRLAEITSEIGRTLFFSQVGVSHPHSSNSEIREACQEAQSAVEHAYDACETSPRVSFFQNQGINENFDTIDLTIEEEQKLANYVLAGSSENIEEAIDRIYEKNACKPQILRKEISLRLYGLLGIVMNSSGLGFSDEIHESILQAGERIREVFNTAQIRKTLTNLYLEASRNVVHSHRDLTDEIFKYIEENISRSISLNLLADTLGMSPGYLSQYFKKAVGMNFVNFVQKMRIENAKGLMLDRDKSINEIAILSGFGSASTFIKTFKKYEGITPGQFIKNQGK